MRPFITLAIVSVLMSVLTGCGKGGSTSPSHAVDPAVRAALDAVFDAPIDGTPSPIPILRREARPGDTVVVEGKIMGVMTPFMDNRAVFVLGDTSTLTSCDERHGDGCKTPWDVCCDPPEAIRAGIATVQIAEAGGGIVRNGLKGFRGLRELSRVRVQGVVADGSSADSLVINARAISILP